MARGHCTTKPGALAPGVCLLSRGAVPRGRGRSCASLVLDNSLIVGSEGVQLWAELPALAPGARCRGRRSVRSGAPEAMQWTAVQARNIGDPLRVLEQGPDRQRAPIWCSGGLSSIRGASESRCSHDGSGGQGWQELQRIRYRSSPEAMGVHEGSFMVLELAVQGLPAELPRPAGWHDRAAHAGHRGSPTLFTKGRLAQRLGSARTSKPSRGLGLGISCRLRS